MVACKELQLFTVIENKAVPNPLILFELCVKFLVFDEPVLANIIGRTSKYGNT